MTVAGIIPFPSAQAKLAIIFFINEHNMSSSQISKGILLERMGVGMGGREVGEG